MPIARKALVAASLGFWVLAVSGPVVEALECDLEPGPARAVVQVLDGETLALDDGTQVRLSGALAPRALDGGAQEAAWPLEHAAKAKLERLALAKSVELGVAGRRTDRYGQLLAQVFVREGDRRVWLQGEMLRTGHARVYALPGSTDCTEALLLAEQQARSGGVGLWTHAGYQIRSASRSWDLIRFRSTYQIVEGRIVKVAATRGHTYLNFGPNRRIDFTAIVRPTHKAAFDRVKFDFKSLERRRVRVRGWIELRFGPMVEIYHPSQIEVLQD